MKHIKENIDKEKYTIPMLEKSFALLDLFLQYPRGLSIQEAVKLLDVSKTTVYRLLNSFHVHGYMIKDEESQRFSLSKKFLRLGLAAIGESNIVERSQPYMRALRDNVKETVLLGDYIGGKIVLLETVLGSHDFVFFPRPGTTFGMHVSAPGKLYLAYMPEQEREDVMKKIEYTIYNDHTIADSEQMMAEIYKIRKQGYAVDLEEQIAGVHCIAAPVFNQFGQIVAAIWTSGPSGRMTRASFSEVSKEVISTANAISTCLGHREFITAIE